MLGSNAEGRLPAFDDFGRAGIELVLPSCSPLRQPLLQDGDDLFALLRSHAPHGFSKSFAILRSHSTQYLRQPLLLVGRQTRP
jgi:hypothetical protein